ncbi:uncharacterized protein LOC119829703 isoform X3 [Zerene cesonia]|uniref:uncharacterized protein LOC119829703 isoform X3 n=1 Tax=Zerene cesonia TaxID=33412 RepID=UPI0018E590C2|nr:uncharacterized protein LOC119829703 isoform X3 [Zerene cesonia]
MKGLVTLSAILLQLTWCYGYPDPRGVGAYAYQDTAGNRVIANLEAHRLASYAPFNAFDMTANHIGEFPNFSRFPQYGPPNFFGSGGLPFDMSQPNSAFASGVAGPGFSHQIAAINPESDRMKNVEITNRFNDDPGNNKFYSVSSSSYSSSANLGGQELNHRGAETVVNNNGRITKYRVNA